MATEHLLELGRTHIALIGCVVNSYAVRRREQGFDEALSQAGIRRRSSRCVGT
jgi:DNA-binding LacI/PurR family transcriptional regulator